MTELGFTDAHRVRQHGLEHGLQLAGRTRDNPQHLRGGRLLLQRLGELLFQLGGRFANAVNVSSRLRSRRTKTAGVGLALCPFARQGHLVGTVDRPMLVAPS
jgi:hypothetical protein